MFTKKLFIIFWPSPAIWRGVRLGYLMLAISTECVSEFQHSVSMLHNKYALTFCCKFKIFLYFVWDIINICVQARLFCWQGIARQQKPNKKTSSKPSKMRFESCITSTRKTENLAHLTYLHAESGVRNKSQLGHLWTVFHKSYPSLFAFSHPFKPWALCIFGWLPTTLFTIQ